MVSGGIQEADMDDRKQTSDTARTGRTLEQLAAEVDRMREWADHFEDHKIWSGRQARRQKSSTASSI